MQPDAREALRLLIVEDSDTDAQLVLRELQRAGIALEARRADSAASFSGQLAEFDAQIILCDFSMPAFDGLSALDTARRMRPETPFIFVSGTIGEENAVRALKNGAADYVLKNNLHRLPTAVERALEIARTRRAHQQAEEACRQSERRFRALIENSSDGLVLIDGQGSVLYSSPATARLLGYEAQEFHPGQLLELVHVDDRPACRRQMQEAARKPGLGCPFQGRVRHRNSTWRVIDGTLTDLTTDPAVKGYVVNFRDITERKQAEDRLSYIAQFDNLTGLPNRHLFHDRLAQTLAQARRNNAKVGLMFIDLDRFKTINDTLGHAAGDKLLAYAGKCFRKALRTGDIVGRIGGDEYAVVLHDLARPDDARVVAQKIASMLAVPLELGGQRISTSASIGIAIYPSDGESAEVLLQNADTAMYRAKQCGRNNHQFYLPEMNERVVERLELEIRLRSALQREEYVLHYQPKIDLGSGRVCGLEGLLRWNHPERGCIPPARFVPILEDTGLILSVGHWVLHTACQQAKQWQERLPRPVPVAVNLSPRQFHLRNLAQTVQRTLEEAGLEPALLELELTESVLMSDAEDAVRTLHALKDLGVHLTLDDFGTGYSSLAYLKRLPLDKLKIDRTFIQDTSTGRDGDAITVAIINLAHSLKLRVIAEGVETDAQLNFLREHGCDEIQGYYYSAAMPAEECEQVLKEEPQVPLPHLNVLRVRAG